MRRPFRKGACRSSNNTIYVYTYIHIYIYKYTHICIYIYNKTRWNSRDTIHGWNFSECRCPLAENSLESRVNHRDGQSGSMTQLHNASAYPLVPAFTGFCWNRRNAYKYNSEAAISLSMSRDTFELFVKYVSFFFFPARNDVFVKKSVAARVSVTFDWPSARGESRINFCK